MRRVGFDDGEARLDWLSVADAIEAGHRLPRADISDCFVRRGGDTLLVRAAWIDGLGSLVKVASVCPGNAAANLPTINGGVLLLDDATGQVVADLDFHLVTKWKTAADSLSAARRLARPDSQVILLVGAGTVAWSLRAAYGAAFPDAQFMVWSRRPGPAAALAAAFPNTESVRDLPEAVGAADIVSCATMAHEPILRGAWLRPGTHVDLIGAFQPHMREADDESLRRARIFVDSRETTLAHIGELKIPIERGVIAPGDVVADFYDPEAFQRETPDEITLFKNGGGAHLDLMTARHIVETLGP